MKKILFLSVMLIVLLICFTNNNDYYVIPNESIRLRIVANSNSIYDQYIKNKVKENIENELFTDLNDSTSISSSRNIIKGNLPKYENIIDNIFKKEEYFINYSINYGFNHFPEKDYKGVKYEGGKYESLVITIGEGNGNNWWCVLFPPICMLEQEEATEVEYTFLVKELFNKYFKK